MPTLNNLLLNVFIILLAIFGTFYVYHVFKGKYTRVSIGIFSSLSVILCMSFEFTLFPGQYYDLRIIPLLLGILYGGTGAGLAVTTVALTYRYILGGSGFIQMAITFIPVLIIAFYLIRNFEHFSRTKKIVAGIALELTIVTFNILMVIVQYPITRWHITFLLEWALIETVGMGLMLFLIEIRHENIAMTLEMQQLEKSQLIAALAASVAHEIRNPLTVCRGFLQLLNENIKDETQLTYTNMVLLEIDRATSVITDYLTYSKPNITRKERIEASVVTEKAIETITPYASLKNVRIHQELERALFIHIDTNKFIQALINIMKNGIEAMPDGGTLTVRVHREHRMAALEIRDTGIGMTREQINRLGNPFYSTKSSGTGLGLMAVYRFVHEMKGKIAVKSTERKGTCFSIYMHLHNEMSSSESQLHPDAKRTDKVVQLP